MADVGYWALVLTLVLSAYTAVASILGRQKRSAVWLESARNSGFAAAVTATVAAALLLALLVGRDYSIRYVFEHVSNYLPVGYTVSAFWAGQEGSLLLWLWLLSIMTAAMILWKQAWSGAAGPYVLAAMAFAQAFLALSGGNQIVTRRYQFGGVDKLTRRWLSIRALDLVRRYLIGALDDALD